MSDMLDMLDPLNEAERPGSDEEEYGSPTGDQESAVSEVEHASSVLGWSVAEVQKWLQKSVDFEPDRIQEFTRSFQKESIDGLGLLTLQRNNRACLGMSDSEWLHLKASRRRLLTLGDKDSLSELSKLAMDGSVGSLTPPSTPPGSRGQQNGTHHVFNGLRECHGGHSSYDSALFASPRKWSIPGFRWGNNAKDEQIESLRDEVLSLRGEVVGVEERETTLKAQLDHLDEVLKTSQISGYIHTRTRWTVLPGEPPIIDDTDVDDWKRRFLVLRGSTICFYLHATDLRPQGTILLQEIVDAGPIPRKSHHQGDRRWSGFHITTCHGLILECSSMQKTQIDSWLTAVGDSYIKVDGAKPHIVERHLSGAWLKILPVETDECLSQEYDLFGAV